MTRGKQWTLEELPVDQVRPHKSFQMRAGGINRTHVNKLVRVLKDGKGLEPIKVAKVGQAHYVVDGFHRLAAHEQLRLSTIKANVSKMSLPEAKAEAHQANTEHGLNLSRADKSNIFADFVGTGRHLDADGAVKSSRAIAAELHQIYSHETVRTKLKELGVELDEDVEYGGSYKPRYGTEEELEADLGEERDECLTTLVALFYSMEVDDRARLLVTVRDMAGALERGERPVYGLDI